MTSGSSTEGGTSRGASHVTVTIVVLFAVAAFSVLATLVSVGRLSVSVGVSAVSTPMTLVSLADDNSVRSHRLQTTSTAAKEKGLPSSNHLGRGKAARAYAGKVALDVNHTATRPVRTARSMKKGMLLSKERGRWSKERGKIKKEMWGTKGRKEDREERASLIRFLTGRGCCLRPLVVDANLDERTIDFLREEQ